MLFTYPALFYYDDTDVDNRVPYYVYFPDIGGAGTQGRTINEAMAMASDYLGLMLADDIENGRELSPPSLINELSLVDSNPFKDDKFNLNYDIDKSFVSLVSVDVQPYLDQQKLVKKTLTIPKWADKMGKELGLNFSQVLTEAIADKKLYSK